MAGVGEVPGQIPEPVRLSRHEGYLVDTKYVTGDVEIQLQAQIVSPQTASDGHTVLIP